MKPLQRPSMTDRQLSALLKRLRERPAAPQDFRGRVLARLESEGLIRGGQARISAPERWGAWLRDWRPAGLGLAGAAALGLAWMLRPVAPRVAVVAAPPTVAAVAVQPRHHRHAIRPALDVALAAPAVAASTPPPPKAEVQASVASAPLAAEPAVGSAPQAAPANQVFAAGPHATDVTGSGSGQGGSKDSPVGSRIRSNVIHASHGESASVDITIRSGGHVRVDLLDRLGRTVAVLYDGDGIVPGVTTTFSWSGGADTGGMAPSGIYLLRVLTPDYAESHKVMLIK